MFLKLMVCFLFYLSEKIYIHFYNKVNIFLKVKSLRLKKFPFIKRDYPNQKKTAIHDSLFNIIYYSDFLIISNHKSFNNWSSISDGDPNIGSRYFWFLGNAITSRIFSFPVNIITILSSPNAHHPWGGTQNVKHFKIWPNLNWISFSSSPRIVKITRTGF